MKRLISCLLAAAVFLSLCACDRISRSVADYPVTVGECTLNSAPSSVAVLYDSAAQAICAMGGGTRVCGVPDGFMSDDTPNAVSVGSTAVPDTERLISLSPDLVITTSFTSDVALSKLYDSGIKVIKLDAPYLFSELKPFYSELGAALSGNISGRTAAEKSFDMLYAKIKETAGKFELPENKIPAAALSDGGIAYSADSIMGEIMNICGLEVSDNAQIVLCEDANTDFAKKFYPNADIIAFNYDIASLCGNTAVLAVNSICTQLTGG